MPLTACLVCGLPSTGRRCARHELTARPRGRPHQRTRQRIFDRDGWRCQECGTQLDPRPHRSNSAVLGHRSPRVLAGAGVDDYANLYSSCADCNSTRGAVPFGR
jgi:5-methylcytosine-specific restriction endonuclease McrA